METTGENWKGVKVSFAKEKKKKTEKMLYGKNLLGHAPSLMTCVYSRQQRRPSRSRTGARGRARERGRGRRGGGGASSAGRGADGRRERGCELRTAQGEVPPARAQPPPLPPRPGSCGLLFFLFFFFFFNAVYLERGLGGWSSQSENGLLFAYRSGFSAPPSPLFTPTGLVCSTRKRRFPNLLLSPRLRPPSLAPPSRNLTN